ncbi:MAG: plasmid pRiA4b ORF-3 family protein [Deltaproteobacteria bacterium]|jgi:hypothetical protein|nr:plasmid pRiA4b ORF-3 family protein [Deltaproteobacteria bacterium]
MKELAGCGMAKPEVAGKMPPIQFPFYSFRIELKEIKPKIWRYFYAPSNISLKRFHNVIQEVMGWSNYHLFSFRIFGEDFMDSDADDPFSFLQTRSGLSRIKLDSLGLSKGSRFTYMYDMGDGWDHVIKVLDDDYVPKTPKRKYGCFKGARACPPEDCGGPYGYENLLEILGNPDHMEHEERMEWAGGPLDPEAFDMDAINDSLRHIR